MKFDKLRSKRDGELDCNCLEAEGENMTENTSDVFAKRIALSELAEEDFFSYYEADRPAVIRNCRAHCKHRGVSIDKLDDKNKELIREKYKKSLAYAPEGFPPYYCEFKFLEGAGYIWDTRSDKNPTHYTLLKCDEFTKDYVSDVKIEPLI